MSSLNRIRALSLLLTLAGLFSAASAHAGGACSKSEKLYDAVAAAGFTVNGVWVSAPKGYTDATPLYELLQGYDFAVLKPGSTCKKMLEKLQSAVFTHVRTYGTFVRPPQFRGSEAYMLSNDGAIHVDGKLLRAPVPGGAQLPGLFVPAGEHVIQVGVPRLPAGQRLQVTAQLDGDPLLSSAPGTFSVTFASGEAGKPVVHDLTFEVTLVRECQATVTLDGPLTEPMQGREVIFDVPTAGRALTAGANPLPGELHKLQVLVTSDQAEPLAQAPLLILDGGALPFEETSANAQQRWEYDIDLRCPEGIAVVQKQLTAKLHQESAEAESPSSLSAGPTWHFWAAAGLTGVAATVGVVSYLSAEDRTQQWEDLAEAEGCAEGQCDAATLAEIGDLFDEAQTRTNLAVGGFVVAGVGAVGMALSWIYRAELASTPAETTALVPVVGRSFVGLGATGRF
jgi:hypothetical protein